MYVGLYAVIVPWLMRHLRGTRDKCFYRCALKTSAKLRLLFEITSDKLKIFNFIWFDVWLRFSVISGSFFWGKDDWLCGYVRLCLYGLGWPF